MSTYTLGIDLGGTNIKVGLLDEDNQLIARDAGPTVATQGPDLILQSMARLARDLIARTGLSPTDVRAAGLGMPGPMSQSRGLIFQCANLPGWNDYPVRRKLASALRLPTILENDANAAAFGEFVAGAGRGAADMVLLTLGTGVGGGVILGGRMLQGALENAGEIGHMIVEPDGRPCPCGQRGCLERYSSANAIAERFAEAVVADQTRGGLAARVQAGEEISARDVAAAAADGDPLAGEIWDDACRRLALAIVNVQHLLNPHCVVLGGGMANAGAQLLDPIRAHYRRMRWRLIEDFPQIELATLGENAGMIGSAALARAVIGAPLTESA